MPAPLASTPNRNTIWNYECAEQDEKVLRIFLHLVNQWTNCSRRGIHLQHILGVLFATCPVDNAHQGTREGGNKNADQHAMRALRSQVHGAR